MVQCRPLHNLQLGSWVPGKPGYSLSTTEELPLPHTLGGHILGIVPDREAKRNFFSLLWSSHF